MKYIPTENNKMQYKKHINVGIINKTEYNIFFFFRSPTQIRTAVLRMKISRPSPLDDRAIVIVGVARFELAASCSQSTRSDLLSHTPIL